MKKILISLAFLLIAAVFNLANCQTLDKTVDVGGAAMYPTKNIVENAMNSKSHTTLVAAVKATGLAETLGSPGPFTVFAPTNDAFENLPQGTVENLLKPENKSLLGKVLTYHVVAGQLNFDNLSKQIMKNNGKLSLKTVNGAMLMFAMNGMRNIMVWDENGNGANISVYDVMQSNGVIHVIDSVLLPKM